MDFSTLRLYGSIAIILGCFIFLYPKLLHPLIMAMFGSSGNQKSNEMDDFLPPPLRNRNPNVADSRQDIPDNIRRNMRHSPHPGMRAAAAEQSKQTKGSGRGMMGVILPMYAVGIVVYLIYTLCKVFNKKDDKHHDRSPDEGQSVQDHSTNNHFSEDNEELDMHKLQERLAETEAQMSKILAAMKAVQGKVDTSVLAQATQGIPSEKQQQQQENQASPADKDSSAESTPDSDSYEIVNRSNEESNLDEDRSGQPETIQSKTSEEMDKNIEEEVTDDVEGDEEEDTQQSQGVEEEDTGDEVEEVLMQDKNDQDEDESRTVRKRNPKTEDSQS